MASRSRLEYEKRLHAVIEHIDRHLDESLDLATLAAVRLSPLLLQCRR